MVNFILASVGWGTTPKWVSDILQPIINVLNSFLLPVIIILGVAGMIYGIVLGVQYAKAESADTREENKKRMIHGIIGIVITLVILILMKVFTQNADSIFGWVNQSSGDVTITIEIGEGKATKSEAAAILVKYNIYSQSEAEDKIGDQTRIVISLSQEEYKKYGETASGKGITVAGVKAETSGTTAPSYQSDWIDVTYSVA